MRRVPPRVGRCHHLNRVPRRQQVASRDLVPRRTPPRLVASSPGRILSKNHATSRGGEAICPRMASPPITAQVWCRPLSSPHRREGGYTTDFVRKRVTVVGATAPPLECPVVVSCQMGHSAEQRGAGASGSFVTLAFPWCAERLRRDQIHGGTALRLAYRSSQAIERRSRVAPSCWNQAPWEKMTRSGSSAARLRPAVFASCPLAFTIARR